MQKTFKETVLAMSAKEIIMNMVEGLRHPSVRVAMTTYGGFVDGICFGCAATNMACRISGKVFTDDRINFLSNRSAFIGVDLEFLHSFEKAINCLREGNIDDYNCFAFDIGMTKIVPMNVKMSYLTSFYSDFDLQCYINLANSQK